MAERSRPPRRDSMPRVRIGLTGLAAVFLLVLIAAALFGNQHPVRRTVPEEPLAELGVAPGGSLVVKSSEAAKVVPNSAPHTQASLPIVNRQPRAVAQATGQIPIVAPPPPPKPAATAAAH